MVNGCGIAARPAQSACVLSGLSVYRCVAAGVKPKTTVRERCDGARVQPNPSHTLLLGHCWDGPCAGAANYDSVHQQRLDGRLGWFFRRIRRNLCVCHRRRSVSSVGVPVWLSSRTSIGDRWLINLGVLLDHLFVVVFLAGIAGSS